MLPELFKVIFHNSFLVTSPVCFSILFLSSLPYELKFLKYQWQKTNKKQTKVTLSWIILFWWP